MFKPDGGKAIETSCRLFQRLLAVYPRAHREEYGAAILQLFRDQCRDAWGRARARGLIRFWIHAFADLLKTSFLEHLLNLNRSKSMLKFFRPRFTPFPIFFRIFGSVFLIIFLGSALITWLCPKTYQGCARLLVRTFSLNVQPPANPQSLYSSLINAEFQIIESHSTLAKVSEALNLPEVWGKKYGAGQPMSEAEVEAKLKARFSVIWVRNSEVIEIRAYSENPEEAAQLANKIAENYRQVRNEQAPKTSAPARGQVEILQVATPEMRAIRPNGPLNMVLGFMMGVLVGLISGTIGAGLNAALKISRKGSPALGA